MSGSSEDTRLPGLELVQYFVRGPKTLMYGDGAGLETTGDITIGYRQTGSSVREWTVTFGVDRAYLLPMARAGVIDLSMERIIGYNIQDPITLRFQPGPNLTQALDGAEAWGPLIARGTGTVEPQVRVLLRDVRELRFIGAEQ